MAHEAEFGFLALSLAVKATVHARLMALKAFFLWLASQPGYRSKLNCVDTLYFNPTANDSRIATATRERRFRVSSKSATPSFPCQQIPTSTSATGHWLPLPC
jgi:hypothetical protein